MSSDDFIIKKINKNELCLPTCLKLDNETIEKIRYITICSSVATTGKNTEINKIDYDVNVATKANLARASEDVEKMQNFSPNKAQHLLNKENMSFQIKAFLLTVSRTFFKK